MRLLLDECIDRKFAREFPGYEVKTVDRNLSFQQNLPQFDIAVIVLQAPSNRLADLKPLAPQVLAILDSVVRGQVTVVSA